MSAVSAKREFAFTRQNFEFISELVYEQTGITLSDSKVDLVYNRLSRRIRKLGLDRFDEYIALVADPVSGKNELSHLINAITTNLTSFFREMHHFEYLAQDLLPKLMEIHRLDRRIRIWSAGCSTGEEPYSIAMILRETIPNIDLWDVRILATDLDSNVVATGQKGIYSEERVDSIEKSRLRSWFQRGRGENVGSVRVVDDLRKMITFRQLNLIKEWPHHGLIDVIFCRNVVIYFDKPTQSVLFDRYASLLPNHGRLIVGHSESLAQVADRFELVGKTVYKKTGVALDE